MARKKGGLGDKILNFIGLVDDDEPRDIYMDEEEDGRYGERSSYTPRARQATSTRSEVSRRYIDEYEPTRARMDRSKRDGARRTYGGSAPSSRNASSARPQQRTRPGGDNQRPVSRFGQQSAGYDYTPRTRQENTGSRFDQPEERSSRRVEDNQQRTIVYKLLELTDCRDIIEKLVEGISIVLTIETEQETDVQRVVDILSGAIFALHGTIRKAGTRTYLIAPQNVAVDDTEDRSGSEPRRDYGAF